LTTGVVNQGTRPTRAAKHAARAALWKASVAVDLVSRRWLSDRDGTSAFELKLASARAVRRLDRTRGGSIDPARPGRLLLGLEPTAIRRLGQRLSEGIVLVSGTNGKTTTTAMVAAIAERAGLAPVWSRSGLNMANGVASDLAAATRVRGRMRGNIGLFEVDELWLGGIARLLNPRVLVILNLFRDQLDRYGEVDRVAAHLRAAVAELPAACKIVACGDDPRVVELLSERSGTMFFGVDDAPARPLLEMSADSASCPACGLPYAYDAAYLAHLGRFHCVACGRRRPRLVVGATVHTTAPTSMDLRVEQEHMSVRLRVDGMHNAYNGLAAIGVGSALDVPLSRSVAALSSFRPVFGRGETVDVDGGQLKLVLVKNAAGADAVIDSLIGASNWSDLLVCLNDTSVNGRDVSWIWDAAFEQLASIPRRVVCTGRQASEMAMRLKYAGFSTERIRVECDVAAALDDALAGAEGTVITLANYTAMVEVRGILSDRGHAAPYWQ
jgi:UDP-N-acetylmuramyl tripeptide synthase